MAANRHDHFGGSVSAAETTKSLSRVQTQEGTPPVSPWLIEHLEATFGAYVPSGLPASMDDLVSLSSRHSETVGEKNVIDYLKRLLDEQLNPSPRT